MNIKRLTPTFRFRLAGRHAAAFTLVEMLVVITIITILLTVGALGLKNLSQASGISAGVPVAEAVFAEARSIAIGKSTTARVLIFANQDDEERYLRYMLVAYFDDATGRWIAESRGSSLPKGVYFSQLFSKVDHAAGSGDMTSRSEAIDIYGALNQPTANSNLSDNYIYYEYNSEGNFNDPGASFIIGVGNKSPGAQNPKADDSGLKNFGGFVIWRKGTTSLFRHPEQMGLPAGISRGDDF